MEHIIKLRFTPKAKHDAYCFYLNKSDNTSNFIHESFGQSSIPLIGKYNNDEYSLLEVQSLITIRVSPNDASDVRFPNEIVCLLKNINPDMIENNTKSQVKAIKPSDNVMFYWVVLNNKLYDQSKTADVYNIVPHFFLNPHIDFGKFKRIEKVFPVCVCIPEEITESCGIDHFTDDKKTQRFKTGINFQKLRLEFSSMHLKGGGIAFSPNNLKFILQKSPLAHFFLILLDDDNLTHHVFYYWITNDTEIEGTINKNLINSATIDNFVQNMQHNYGDSLDALNYVDKMIIK